jgi:Ca-activated chloride channel homolog
LSRQTPFRAAGDAVPVYVTVTDKDDRLVTDLGRDRFQVSDNGKLQPISLFDASPQPIRLVVLLDVSGSMAGNLGLLRAACSALFARLRPDDLAKVGTFGRDIVLSPTFTNRARELEAALPDFIDANAPTPLWRAVDTAMTELKDHNQRRVVLVFSDSKDGGVRRFNERYIGQPDVVDRAEREDVMIYGVGLRSRPNRPMMPGAGVDLRQVLVEGMPDPGLSLAARDTGGGYFELTPRDDLAEAFGRVADELHTQYLLGFAPPARDGKQHKIEVKVTGRDLKARARRTYRAPR